MVHIYTEIQLVDGSDS